MKKLKKGLSLVLVLVMVFGLATNAFAWDTTYADNDQITYKEAVEAMSGMGIIDGKLDNMFDPAGDYTREQAAKVITYMLLGPEAAKVLEQPTNTGFSDVDAGRWSSGYIAYAAAQDIIVGWGGEFHPEDTLTRAQWLKMLLVALGYDPIENGLEDNLNWETNALTLAIQIGLIDSKEATATFNRELAIQYAFNALNTPTVNKWGRPGDILGAAIFGLNGTTTSTTDEFGRPYETWDNGKAGNDQVIYATNYAEPVLTYSNETVKVADVEKALGEGADIKEIYINGVKSEEQLTEIGDLSTEVEIYATETKNEYRAVVMELQVLKLEENDLKNKAFADFEEGDVVTYFQGQDANEDPVYSNVTKVEGVEGKVTAVGSDYIRVDGEKVFKAKNCELNGQQLNLNATAVFYFDSYGNYIYVDKVAQAPERQPDGYALVMRTEVQDGSEGTMFEPAKDPVAVTRILNLSTGKIEEVKRSITKDANGEWVFAGKNGQPTTSTIDSVNNKEYYLGEVDPRAYFIMDDATYVLEATTKIVGETNVSFLENCSLSSTHPNVGDQGRLATDNTVLKVVDITTTGASGNKNIKAVESVTTYTGISNFPSIDEAYGVYLYDENGMITEILVAAEVETQATTTTNYAVFIGRGEQDENGYHHLFKLADGTEVDYVTKTDYEIDDAQKNQVYNLTYTDGKVTKADLLTAEDSGEVITVQSSYIAIKTGDTNKTYFFANGYQVYGTLKEGATVSVYTNDDGKVEFVNVTAQAETAE